MTETWIPGAIIRPGPALKLGYGGVKFLSLDEIEGEVKHSTEGSLSAALGELDKLDRQASWTGTIDFDGKLYQHYPIEAIAWHAGLPGDRRQDTSLIGNLTLRGFEHVDRIGGAQIAQLTPLQRETTARVSAFMRSVCPRYRANPPRLRMNLWEHRWLSSTACPSDLIPWAPIIQRIEKLEDDMALTPRQEAALEAMAKLTVDKYPVTQTDGTVKEWPSQLDYLMAHTTAFDLWRIDWLQGQK